MFNVNPSAERSGQVKGAQPAPHPSAATALRAGATSGNPAGASAWLSTPKTVPASGASGAYGEKSSPSGEHHLPPGYGTQQISHPPENLSGPPSVCAVPAPGVSEGIRKRIFEPFFTTREVGEGAGLSFCVCYDLIHKHGGEITVESSIGKGSTFVVWLPVSHLQQPE
jgi:hypothetical protein